MRTAGLPRARGAVALSRSRLRLVAGGALVDVKAGGEAALVPIAKAPSALRWRSDGARVPVAPGVAVGETSASMTGAAGGAKTARRLVAGVGVDDGAQIAVLVDVANARVVARAALRAAPDAAIDVGRVALSADGRTIAALDDRGLVTWRVDDGAGDR